jgi:hypothetical protein
VAGICPICGRRKAERFCPARGDSICSVCCGREREVTIDCHSDCSYLISARRYEAEHRKPHEPGELPFPGVNVSYAAVNNHLPLVSAIAAAVVGFSRENRELRDADGLAALQSQVEAFRTLDSGLYYENPPPGALAGALYRELSKALAPFQRGDPAAGGQPRVKLSEIAAILVFLLRLGKVESSPRPRSRAFLDFLRKSFPSAARAQQEASRIIVP